MKIDFNKADLTKIRSLFSVKMVAIVAVALILTASFVYSTLRKDIIITDGDGKKTASTFKSTVADVLKENNIVIKPQDKINVDMSTQLKDGLKIEIVRARTITIQADGKKTCLVTTASTVENALKEAGIKVSKLDKIIPALTQPLAGDTAVLITRIQEKVVYQTVKVEFKNTVVQNPNLDKGIVRVVKKGQNGVKQVAIKIVVQDGQEVGRQVIGDKLIQSPVDGVVEEGIRTELVTSRGRFVFSRSMTMVATAYDATFESCGKTEDNPQYGITASGLRVRPGIVAVDPRVIPLGTWLYVEGYGEALAADRGSAIKGNRIDLYFETPKQVDRYGKKKVKVYVLSKPRYKF